MKVVLFCHSLISDWNHGNAHFLRGIVSELTARGHQVQVYEPEDAWSVLNLIRECGGLPFLDLLEHYPGLASQRYQLRTLDLDRILDGAELVLVHEWNEPALIRAIGHHRSQRGRYALLFHDTHHRAVSDAAALQRLDLSGYDAVLAFGETVRECYLRAGWSRRVFTWHEAADVRVFRPVEYAGEKSDLVWIGNWGDEERTRELESFLMEPAAGLRLSGAVFGVRYPEAAITALRRAGLSYCGFAPNYRVPQLLARHRVTLHIPRAPYVHALPGIPTIRVFEALACAIPLACAPWQDSEGLFREADFLRARDGAHMQRLLGRVLSDPEEQSALSRSGRETILRRHTCAHRVDELFSILKRLELVAAPAARQVEVA